MSLFRLFLTLAALLLPLASHAGDAEDFVTANPAQQARLLEAWAAQPDPARVELINALQQGVVTVDGQAKTLRLNLSLIHI